jgi:branched-chain amino acid aminotransferase
VTVLPFDDRDGFIWLDGSLCEWRQAKVHVLTHGLHYASSVFEGERAYGGRVFRLKDHTIRLAKSAGILGFELPYSVDALIAATREIIATQKIEDGYVRPVAWRGPEEMGLAARGSKIHVAIATWPIFNPFAPEIRSRGIRLKKATWQRPPAACAPVHAKAAGLYMICTMARQAAEAAGFDDALMLDYRGYVAEATGANLFMAKGGKLITPLPDCFLDGITRQAVIGLARREGFELIERHVTPEELEAADEVFLTGTAYEVQPVRAIDDIGYEIGPITRRLAERFQSMVREEAE